MAYIDSFDTNRTFEQVNNKGFYGFLQEYINRLQGHGTVVDIASGGDGTAAQAIAEQGLETIAIDIKPKSDKVQYGDVFDLDPKFQSIADLSYTHGLLVWIDEKFKPEEKLKLYKKAVAAVVSTLKVGGVALLDDARPIHKGTISEKDLVKYLQETIGGKYSVNTLTDYGTMGGKGILVVEKWPYMFLS